MDEELKRKLLIYGTSIDTTVERFMGDELMYVEFLHKFTKDENVDRLKESLEAKDVEKAFHYAHTLKGVAANLGLDELVKGLNPLVENLRLGKLEGLDLQFARMENMYRTLCEIIKLY